MKNIMTLTLLCVLCTLASGADAVMLKTTDKLSDVVDNTKGAALTGVKGPGAAFLDLRGASQAYILKRTFKASGNRKYILTFEYGVGGCDTVEKNDRIPEIQTQSRNLLAGWKTLFFDAKGRQISMRDYAGMTFTHKSGTENDVFYTPSGTSEVRVVFYLPNNESALAIKSVKFSSAPDEGAVNCNPEFKYGYSGWNGFLRGSLLFKDAKGMVFDSAYGTGGEVFPLPGRGKYRLFARGETYGGYTVVNFEQRDKNNRLIKTLSVRGTPQGASIQFDIEPEAVYGRLNVYNHLLREVRLTREN